MIPSVVAVRSTSASTLYDTLWTLAAERSGTSDVYGARVARNGSRVHSAT